QRAEMLLAVTGATKGGSLDKFIYLIIQNNRTPLLRKIALAYVKLYRQQHNIAKVEIETASPLSKEELDRIVGVVKKKLSDVELEISHEINQSLIGGFKVRVDSILLDASIKNELQNLRLKLLS
ncbi:MAG: ATP synthase F1 subunit delta, partial [Muribaculaceae bacterium]|nr:ATP synthase F1 subunit delta [Muribaculaceae bacterium]